VRELVEPVDPNELREGVRHAVAEEGQPDNDYPDLKEVLEAVDPHVQIALHALVVSPAKTEAVENWHSSAEEGSGQERPVESAGVCL